jgi:predicted transglutaminase-like cysteine proteinase
MRPNSPFHVPRIPPLPTHPPPRRRPRLVPVLRGAALSLLLLATALRLPAWDQIQLQQAAERLGPRAVASLKLLLPVLREAARADELARLDRINEFYNRHLLFREDSEVWGRQDHWASPLETLSKGAGDCEDFAIAKYFSLRAAGVPNERLRLVYVQALQGGPNGVALAHMVLAYHARPGAEPLILDNLITEVRPASRRPDLLPVFSFNTEGLWSGTDTGAAGPADPLARLSRWRELLVKARAEGFL